jgi:hypothetical protein
VDDDFDQLESDWDEEEIDVDQFNDDEEEEDTNIIYCDDSEENEEDDDIEEEESINGKYISYH